MGEFIKIPLTEEMKADYRECAGRLYSDAEKDCSTCSMNGGNLGCLGIHPWCSDQLKGD